jgi:cell fate (sporulation/competence/biofilm development) regulator YlbF (YheA/YmcA/DUF963 family)
MPLTDEIQQVAEDLGSQLGADSNVQEYLQLAAQAQEYAEVSALETRYAQLYQSLLVRQRNGEEFDRSEIDEFYRLKGEIQYHPLLIARDDQFTLVKALFSQTAERLTDVLGFEYPTFAG